VLVEDTDLVDDVTCDVSGPCFSFGASGIQLRTVLGNTTIQVGNTYPQAQHVDILNLAPAAEVTFDRNLCGTAVNAPCPAVSGSVGRKPPQH
jgi:hypothetical protein